MKTIILGVGNTIMSDDGVGIYAVRKIGKMLGNRRDIECVESSMGGLKLMELMNGYDRAIIIDAIITDSGEFGGIFELTPEDFPKNSRFISVHDISFLDALNFGRSIDLKLPEDIYIYAIKAKDVRTFSESCTEKVAPAIDKVARMVIERLESKGG